MDLKSLPVKIKHHPFERLLEHLLDIFANM